MFAYVTGWSPPGNAPCIGRSRKQALGLWAALATAAWFGVIWSCAIPFLIVELAGGHHTPRATEILWQTLVAAIIIGPSALALTGYLWRRRKAAN
jgi:hypothetical protein